MQTWFLCFTAEFSADPVLCSFLQPGLTWQKKTPHSPYRGFTDDSVPIPEENRRTAAQKCIQLEYLLSQICIFCPVLCRRTITQCTSLTEIWQRLWAWFGLQYEPPADAAEVHDLDDVQPEDRAGVHNQVWSEVPQEPVSMTSRRRTSQGLAVM